jgi:hypothetical protein
MKVYAPKGHLEWLENAQDEARTRCIIIKSFPEFEDDVELDLQVIKSNEGFL